MTDRELLELANEAGAGLGNFGILGFTQDELRKFAALVRREALEEVDDLYFDALQADLENGVKCLNEAATAEFHAKYPELAKLPDAIRALAAQEGDK